MDVEHAGEVGRLVGDDTDHMPVEPGESAHDVGGPCLVDFEEVALVDDVGDDVANVVGLGGVGGHDAADPGAGAVGRVVGGQVGWQFPVVAGEEAQQVAHVGEAGVLVVVGEVRDSGHAAVGVGTAEFLLGDFFAGDGTDHVGPGHEHLRDAADHEDEVGEGWRVGVAPAQGPRMTLIWGMTPEARTLREKIPPYPARAPLLPGSVPLPRR